MLERPASGFGHPPSESYESVARMWVEGGARPTTPESTPLLPMGRSLGDESPGRPRSRSSFR